MLYLKKRNSQGEKVPLGIKDDRKIFFKLIDDWKTSRGKI